MHCQGNRDNLSVLVIMDSEYPFGVNVFVADKYKWYGTHLHRCPWTRKGNERRALGRDCVARSLQDDFRKTAALAVGD